MFDPYDDRYVESETDRIIQGDKEMPSKPPKHKDGCMGRPYEPKRSRENNVQCDRKTDYTLCGECGRTLPSVDNPSVLETYLFTRLARVLDTGDFYLKYDGKDRFQIVGEGMDDDAILTPSELAEWLVKMEREA